MLPTLFQDIFKFSDCKLVSMEGKLKQTHKIVLAAKSDFLKRLLVDIPEASDAVIILPDFSLKDVEILLEKLTNDESKIQSNLWEMLVKTKQLKTNDFQDMNNADVEKHEVAETFVLMDDGTSEI